MTSDGDTKDDVRMPEGEVGQKITKLFTEEEKDTRRFSTRLKQAIRNSS